MKEKDSSGHITEEWLVDEVLQRYPSTSVVFLQHGPASRIQSAAFSQVNWKNMLAIRGVSEESVLRALNAAAETERFLRRNSWIVNKRMPEVSPGIYERWA